MDGPVVRTIFTARKTENTDAYYGYYRDPKSLETVSSGGAATAISEKILEDGKEKNILQSLEIVIRNGKKALFIGTGCKVAAAINHLKGKELDQSLLYTIDLICYGVPPVKTYTDFVSKLKRKYLSIQVGRQMPHLSLQGQ